MVELTADRCWAVAPWIAVALTPVGFTLGGLGVFGMVVSKETDRVSDWVVVALLLLTAPTAAEMLAARAVHAGDRLGVASAVVAGLVLAAMLALYATSVLSNSGENWITLVIVFAAALGLTAVAWTHHPRREGAGSDAPEA